MAARYDAAMNPISFDLERALAASRRALWGAAHAVATAQAKGTPAPGAQAAVARAAIFSDAVLTAVRAHLEELKVVAK